MLLSLILVTTQTLCQGVFFVCQISSPSAAVVVVGTSSVPVTLAHAAFSGTYQCAERVCGGGSQSSREQCHQLLLLSCSGRSYKDS